MDHRPSIIRTIVMHCCQVIHLAQVVAGLLVPVITNDRNLLLFNDKNMRLLTTAFWFCPFYAKSNFTRCCVPERTKRACYQHIYFTKECAELMMTNWYAVQPPI